MPTLRISDLTIEYVQGGYAVRPVDGLSAEALASIHRFARVGLSGCGSEMTS